MTLLRTQGSTLRVQPRAGLHNAFGVEIRSEELCHRWRLAALRMT